ncbi:MAG: hypothetical protein HZC10_04055 [Nitrospirae bacterium]|nr:hypothetical protein [Nitrospirota bacterium]
MQDLSSEELFKAGVKLLKQGKNKDALASIKAAIKKGGYEGAEEMPPNYLSYLGLAIALAEKRYRDGAELCEKAVKKEFYNPTNYLNLGKIYSVGGYRLKALNAFNDGLRIDRTHKELIEELKKIGVRRRPIIPFLQRKNVLNKFLGFLFHKEKMAKS